MGRKKEEFVTWKTCRTCGEMKELKDFRKMKGRKTNKRPDRLIFYSKECKVCIYTKVNPNYKPREVKSLEGNTDIKMKTFLKALNPKLHQYLHAAG